MEYALETAALTKRYGRFTALDGLTLHVPKGSIYGFVGRNGAGKTTLIRIVCGLQSPTEGGYTLYGVPHTDPAIHRTRQRIGAVVETPSVYPDMTAADNLKQQYTILGMPSYDGLPELLELVGLGDTGKKKARDFSLGMRQRLGIAVALCDSPDLLLLDEPVNGLDPQGIVEIRELILTLNREKGITVLISSHILDELARLATHYGFIDKGRMVKELSAEELEKASRKSLRLTVSDTRPLPAALDTLGVEYTIRSDTVADLYGEVNITQLTLALHAAGCEVKSLTEQEESLESFYLNLVGGDGHE